MNAWACQIKTDESSPGRLTVGDAVTLECQGPEVGLKNEGLRLQPVGTGDAFLLKLLYVERLASSGALLKVTSYRPRWEADLKFVLTDGDNSVELRGVQLNVESVVTPGATPFGPVGPWKMSFPLWMWGVLILFVAFLVTAGLVQFRKMRKHKHLVLEIAEYNKRHDPFGEFQRELRHLARKIDRGAVEIPLAELQGLEKNFRLFLKRTLVQETEGLSGRDVAKIVTEKYEGSEVASRKVREVLVEMARLKGDAISSRDAEQVTRWVGEASELIEDLQKDQEAT